MLESWLNEYGEVTAINFNIYSYYGLRDNAIINAGLTSTLIDSDMIDIRYYQSIEDIDENDAELWNIKRGLGVQWVFPNKMNDKSQQLIIDTISEGLDYLNIAYKLIGVFGDAN